MKMFRKSQLGRLQEGTYHLRTRELSSYYWGHQEGHCAESISSRVNDPLLCELF